MIFELLLTLILTHQNRCLLLLHKYFEFFIQGNLYFIPPYWFWKKYRWPFMRAGYVFNIKKEV